ncbi:MAG: hypothetical protein JXQ72_04595 [Anaerolineae bacterium]|nr:hypothetical protein [Anaerolineae bacterium]
MMNKMRITVVLIGVLLVGIVGGALAQGDDLENSYTSNNGALTISYPEDWVVMEEDGTVFIANAEEVIDEEPLLSGSVGLYLILPDFLLMFGMQADTPPADVLATLIEMLSEEDTTFGDNETLAVGEKEFEMVYAPTTVVGVGEGILGAVALEEGTIGLWAMAAEGEWADAEPLILSILETASYVMPELVYPTDNAVEWVTDTVSLTAENFYVVAGGKVYLADVDEVVVGGDPGSESYTTLEIEWEEYDTPMRVYIYFEADGENWQAFEIRTYDGSAYGEWIYYDTEQYFTSPLGEAFADDFLVEYGSASLVFEGLELQVTFAE